MVRRLVWHREMNEERFAESILNDLKEHSTERKFFITSSEKGLDVPPTVLGRAMTKISGEGVTVVSYNTITTNGESGFLLEVKLNAEWVKVHRLMNITELVTTEFLDGFIEFPWLKSWEIGSLDDYPIDDPYLETLSENVFKTINQRMHSPGGQRYVLSRSQGVVNRYVVIEQMH